jgi:anhydro-N-acetylmuramic acid kinase
MKDLALGLMSGTSADGVSAALVSFSGPRLKTLGSLTLPYPRPLAEKVLDPEELSLAEISALNFSIGEVFAQAALRLLALTQTRPDRVSVIGSHGQTLHHSPRTRPAHTLQHRRSQPQGEPASPLVASPPLGDDSSFHKGDPR